MIMYFILKVLLFSSIQLGYALTSFDIDQLPDPVPELCFEEVGNICRASLPRWTFDAVTNQCRNITHGGCGFFRNQFITRAECEETCRRNPIDLRDFGSESQSCTFQANFGGECELDTEVFDIEFCPGAVNGISSSDCRDRGCCYHNLYQICYHKATALSEGLCDVKYASENGFYGKLSFQPSRFYSAGWIGNLHLTTPVTGSLCILRDSDQPSGLVLSPKTFDNRTIFLLESQYDIYPGQTTVIILTGSYGNSDAFSRENCESINSP